MQTAIAEEMLAQPAVRESERILRACVHCGFCNATCPTYQLNGTELEGPRGRIYLIKSVLEQRIELNASVVAHLDTCLSCLACETTCPSGVSYRNLIDPMRDRIETQYQRPLLDRLRRRMLALLLPYPRRFRLSLLLARLARPLAFLLPRSLRAMVAAAPRSLPPRSRLAGFRVHAAQGVRKARVALLTGCAQSVLAPHINDASLRVLNRVGCEVVLPPEVECCGALVFHMGDRARSLPHMRRAIDAWCEELEGGGLDMIVINTSGCGAVVRDYGHIFRDDPEYQERAQRISELTVDISEAVERLGLPEAPHPPAALRVAYHDACSLQHGQRVRAQPRLLLREAGFHVLDVPEGHLCCGSAGTYNLLQPAHGEALGRRKAAAVDTLGANVVAAGNIGCIEQIARYTDLPVVHTVELLDWATGGPAPKDWKHTKH